MILAYLAQSCSLFSTATKAGSSSSSPGPSPAKASQGSVLSPQFCQPDHKDCLFREFRKLCGLVSEKSSYNTKTEIIKDFLKKGTGGGRIYSQETGMCPKLWFPCCLWNNLFFFSSSYKDKFKGDLYLTVKLLLPGVVKSVYNLNDKQIVKLFSRILNCNQDEMVRDLEKVSALPGKHDRFGVCLNGWIK